MSSSTASGKAAGKGKLLSTVVAVVVVAGLWFAERQGWLAKLGIELDTKRSVTETSGGGAGEAGGATPKKQAAPPTGKSSVPEDAKPKPPTQKPPAEKPPAQQPPPSKQPPAQQPPAQQPPATETQPPTAGTIPTGTRRVLDAFRRGRSDVQVTVEGRVARTLRDDEEGSRHQRFIFQLDGSDHTVLVAHNIDLAPRVPLKEGDRVSIAGEYEYNEEGGVLHWTHHDPARRHPDGWIRHDGKTYK
ncbi:MAG: DUF3465 domain-containing protein [Planctomycetota bacterium]